MAFMCLRAASLAPLSLSNCLAFHSFTCETTDIFSTCQHSHKLITKLPFPEISLKTSTLYK